MSLLLAGDIGGTNSRFCLYEVASVQGGGLLNPDAALGGNKLKFEKRYKNEDFQLFHDVVTAFFHDAKTFLKLDTLHVVTGCIAVAGPVATNKCALTNIGWQISGRSIESAFKIGKVRLVNDFVAAGYGTLTLDETHVRTLQKGHADSTKPIAVIGAGTGLGQVFMTPSADSGLYEAFPSEGGHVEFAPRDQLEFDLLEFVKAKLGGRVSVERIVSGRGIVTVYEFLWARHKKTNGIELDKDMPPKMLELYQKVMQSTEGGKVIQENETKDELCRHCISMVLSAYGAETGNLGLKFMPYGGLFIAGGIILKLLHHFGGNDSETFMKAFRTKGRLSPELDRIPLKIVLAPDLGIRGAHVVANRQFYAEDDARDAKPGVSSLTASPTGLALRSSGNDSAEGTAFFAVGLAAAVIGFFALYKSSV